MLERILKFFTGLKRQLQGGENLTHVYMYALTSIAVLALAFNAIKFELYTNQGEAIQAIRQVERQLTQSERIQNHLLELQLSSGVSGRRQILKETREESLSLAEAHRTLTELEVIREYCESMNCPAEPFIYLSQMTSAKMNFDPTPGWVEGSQNEIKAYRTRLENLNQFLDETTNRTNNDLITLDIAFLACLLFFLLFQAVFIFKPAVSKLNHALSVRSDFLSRISHEIRNPMNSVLGMAEVLKGTKLNMEQRQYVDSLLRAGQTLLEMLNNLIDVAAVEGKKIKLKSVSFEIFQLIDKTSQVVSSMAHQKGIEFFVKVDPRIQASYRSDVTRLEQVLINLLNNAVKFTSKGYVLLELKLVSTGESSSCICFSVKDTGIGIDKAKTEEIFNSFVQEDSSIKREFGGSGLGLSIASEILSLMGTELKVESEKGVGSEFYFDIDLAYDQSRDTTAPKKRPPIILFTTQFSDVLNTILEETFERHWICEDEEALSQVLSEVSESVDIVVDDSVGIINMILASDLVKKSTKVTTLNALLKTSFPKENIDLIRKAGYSNFMLKPFRPWFFDSFESMDDYVFRSDSEDKTSVQKFPLKVLAVDDSEDNLFLIREILSPLVNRIDFARNGQEAVDMVQSTSYDIIFMDIQMPVMDGYTAIRQIRTLDEKNIPVIAVTAHGGVIDEKRCLEAGFSARLVKPIGRNQIVNVLEEFYGRSVPETEIDIETVNVKEEEKMKSKTIDDPLIIKLLPTFFATRENDLSFVEEALKTQDFDQLKALGHKMKGSSLSYGFENIGAKGKALEDAALNHDLDKCRRLYHEIRRDVEQEKEKYSIH